MPKVLIAVPCMDTLPVEFVQSMSNLQKPIETATSYLSGSMIYDARDRFAQAAITGNFDYVLWIDSDMVFEPDLLHRLLESIEGRDFVCGLYFRRMPPYTPAAYETLEPFPMPVMEVHKNIFEIGAAGFGCVLTRTKMLKDVFDKFGTAFCPFEDMGEDIAFCKRAKSIGYKLHCDPTVKVGHVGRIIVNETQFTQYMRAVLENA